MSAKVSKLVLLSLKTLRNKASPEVRKTMLKFLHRNDHVQNKDRWDSAAVIRLVDEKLIEYLQQQDFVSHTILPEMDTLLSTAGWECIFIPSISLWVPSVACCFSP